MTNNKALEFKKAHLAAHANLNSSLFFMICELVDNSISSFLARKRRENLKDYSDCFINIYFFVEDETKKGLTVEHFLIEDNADGIESERLFDCLQEGHSDNAVVDSELNNFGVGMKQAVFYIGKIMSISTRSVKEDFISTNLIDVSDPKEYDQQVVIDINTLKDELHFRNGLTSNKGTIIEVKDLNVNCESKIHGDIINWLQNKYYNYLKEGLQINYNLNFKNSKYLEENSKTLVCEKLAYFNLTQFDEMVKKSKKAFDLSAKAIEEVENIWNKKETKFIGEEVFKNSVIEKIKNREDFVWDINEVIIDDIKVTGEVGFVADKSKNKNYSYSNYAGLTLYQGGRAIYCPPAKGADKDSPNNTGPYWEELGFGSSSSGHAGEKRRVTGYIDVSELVNKKDNENNNLYLKPDSNKRSLIWIQGTGAKETFNNYFKNLFELIAKYIKTIDKIQYKINSPEVKEHIAEETDFILDSFNPDVVDTTSINIENKVTKIKLVGNNKLNLSIVLKEESTIDPFEYPQFISFEETESEEGIDIKILLNPNSNFLRPIMPFNKSVSPTDKNYLNNVGWIFGITQLYINIFGPISKIVDKTKYKCDIFDKLDSVKNMKLFLENNDFLSILSEVTLLIWNK